MRSDMKITHCIHYLKLLMKMHLTSLYYELFLIFYRNLKHICWQKFTIFPPLWAYILYMNLNDPFFYFIFICEKDLPINWFLCANEFVVFVTTMWRLKNYWLKNYFKLQIIGFANIMQPNIISVRKLNNTHDIVNCNTCLSFAILHVVFDVNILIRFSSFMSDINNF